MKKNNRIGAILLFMATGLCVGLLLCFCAPECEKENAETSDLAGYLFMRSVVTSCSAWLAETEEKTVFSAEDERETFIKDKQKKNASERTMEESNHTISASYELPGLPLDEIAKSGTLESNKAQPADIRAEKKEMSAASLPMSLPADISSDLPGLDLTTPEAVMASEMPAVGASVSDLPGLDLSVDASVNKSAKEPLLSPAMEEKSSDSFPVENPLRRSAPEDHIGLVGNADFSGDHVQRSGASAVLEARSGEVPGHGVSSSVTLKEKLSDITEPAPVRESSFTPLPTTLDLTVPQKTEKKASPDVSEGFSVCDPPQDRVQVDTLSSVKENVITGASGEEPPGFRVGVEWMSELKRNSREERDIRLFLAEVARKCGLELIMSCNVQGKCRVNLQDAQSAEDIFRCVLNATGYGYVCHNRIIYVTRRGELSDVNAVSFKRVSRVFTPRYATISEFMCVAETLKSPSGKVSMVEGNSVILAQNSEKIPAWAVNAKKTSDNIYDSEVTSKNPDSPVMGSGVCVEDYEVVLHEIQKVLSVVDVSPGKPVVDVFVFHRQNLNDKKLDLIELGRKNNLSVQIQEPLDPGKDRVELKKGLSEVSGELYTVSRGVGKFLEMLENDPDTHLSSNRGQESLSLVSGGVVPFKVPAKNEKDLVDYELILNNSDTDSAGDLINPDGECRLSVFAGLKDPKYEPAKKKGIFSPSPQESSSVKVDVIGKVDEAVIIQACVNKRLERRNFPKSLRQTRVNDELIIVLAPQLKKEACVADMSLTAEGLEYMASIFERKLRAEALESSSEKESSLEMKRAYMSLAQCFRSVR